jgi:peptidoglycan hydrolase-like protein with peptidoglycan-binding domain
MSKKTIIIFIIVFLLVGGFVAWLSLSSQKTTTTEQTSTPWYQSFNPFGTGITSTNTTPQTEQGVTENTNQENAENTTVSRFYKITDLAVAGATFLNDTRQIKTENVEGGQAKQEIITLNPNTKEGRIDIQKFLNENLSLKPQLKTDGNFGKLTTRAISDFQKQNSLVVTGKIDTETAPFFTKTIEKSGPKNQYEQVASLRYVEKMNGHMYKFFLDTKVSEKISNSTIPAIYEAFFDNTAKTIIYRYLSSDKTISSFIATLGAPKGDFLPQDVSDISISPDKTKFFYLTKNNNGVTGTVGLFGSAKRDLVFNSSFTEWLSAWSSNQKIFLTTKPSYTVAGSIFLLNTTTRTLTKIFGGIDGLTTLIGPTGSAVLFSSSSKTGPKLGIFNINKHETKDLNVYGLPEKCVWSNDGVSVYCALPNTITGNQYPDYWYQGLISFDDYFVKINTETGDMSTFANSTDETPIDATHLFLDTQEETLFFINKKDSTLWSLNLR